MLSGVSGRLFLLCIDTGVCGVSLSLVGGRGEDVDVCGDDIGTDSRVGDCRNAF